MMETVQALFPKLVKRTKGWLTRYRGLRWLILLVILMANCLAGCLLAPALGGIVENLSWRALEQQILPWLRGTTEIGNWIICVLFLPASIVIVLMVLVGVLMLRLRTLRRTSLSLSLFDTSYLWFLQWFDNTIIWPTLRKLIEGGRGGADASARFADVCFRVIAQKVRFIKNVTILRPEDSDSEWLTVWRSFHQYGGIQEATRLYIGDYEGDQEKENPDKQRGVRGRVFVTGESAVVNILLRQEWIADDDDFRPPYVDIPCPYDAFLAVRMSIGKEPFGVLFIEVEPSAEVDTSHCEFFEVIGCRIALGISLLELSL